MLRLFNSPVVPFGWGSHVDDSDAAVFQTCRQLMGRCLFQLHHGPAAHQPGHDAAGQIPENQIVANPVQLRHHPVVVALIIHYQNNFSGGVHHHADPVGQLLFKPDVDAARNMKTAKGGGVTGIDNDCPIGDHLFKLPRG